jgi:peptidyl-prolyl cis-trans isomerase B (cyclophilin B)
MAKSIGSITMFLLYPLLLLSNHVTGFSCPQMSMSMNGSIKSFNRRDVIQSTLASAFVVLGGNPSVAAYIDPLVDLPKVTSRVYIDVQIGERETGRLVIGLFGDLTPRLTENFSTLCKGNAYAGTSFYRVVSDFTIQGGAVGDPTGKTGQSAFGAPFEPDNFNLKHTKAGLVSAVRGVGGAVDSRFFVNCKDDAGWADDRYAAFGIVEEGLDFVKKIEKVDVQPPQNRPKVEVKILASGVIS